MNSDLARLPGYGFGASGTRKSMTTRKRVKAGGSGFYQMPGRPDFDSGAAISAVSKNRT
jgi:hypothetical protein